MTFSPFSFRCMLHFSFPWRSVGGFWGLSMWGLVYEVIRGGGGMVYLYVYDLRLVEMHQRTLVRGLVQPMRQCRVYPGQSTNTSKSLK